MKLALVCAALLALGSVPASAATIDSETSGLSSPAVNIGFDEISLMSGELVIDQYSGLGVSFSPALAYLGSFSAGPNISGPSLINIGGSPLTIFNPFSIAFENAVSGASFAFVSADSNTTFEALLNGVVVESFSSMTGDQIQSYYGFTGIVFDEIRVTVGAPGMGILDDLSFNYAAVPLPASLAFLLAGLGGLAIAGRKRA